jgi:ATP synthase protein I
MNEFHRLARSTVKNTLILTFVFAALWALLPSQKSIFAGLTIGSAVSLYFAVSASKQTEMAADVALRQVKKRPSVIMVYRMVMILAAVLVVQALEQKIGYVSLPGLLIGFFVYQFVLLGGFLYNKLTTS